MLGLILWLLGAGSGFGGESTFTEYQVKALFLLNFTKYVDWPATAVADTNTHVTIGIYGDNQFGDNLQKAVAGRVVNGRSIVIRQIDNTNDLVKCQVLFLNCPEPKDAAKILALVKTSPVLTVGETDQFTGQGGIIRFLKKDGKVRLEINLPAAQLANLRISSKLLSVADNVIGATK